MRKLLAFIYFFVGSLQAGTAYGDAFFTHLNTHLEACSVDSRINIAKCYVPSFIGQMNPADIIIDTGKISAVKSAKLTNRYGFYGQHASYTSKVNTVMDIERLSISGLYGNKHTRYAACSPADKRHKLSAFDMLTFLNHQPKNGGDAIELINSYQIVPPAVEINPSFFQKSKPLHYVLFEKAERSVVIRLVKSKTLVYDDSENVMPNYLTYAQQREMNKNALEKLQWLILQIVLIW